MRKLKSEGVSFIYISHKMPEVFEICDLYTVLRDGAFIQSGAIKDINEHTATELLIGKTFVSTDLKEGQASTVTEEVVFSARGLSGLGFYDVCFEVRRGEIVVITGLQGSGTDELATALFGATPIKGGTLATRRGTLSTRSIQRVMKNGIAMIPRNRKERGIVPDLSIQQNNSLAFFTAKHPRLFISKKAEHERFERSRAKLDIKVSSEFDPITSLSGGNQQKVILGKWLAIDADLYIMDNPTQGIDVGSKYAIYKLINALAAEGKAVVVFSSEYPEIHQLADRCLVLYKGRINAALDYKDLSEMEIMKYSTGGTQAGAAALAEGAGGTANTETKK
jgi:ribose transport system ATP-binding protein